MSKKPKIFVTGYAGGINVGDEAIVATVAHYLQANYNADITIGSGQPALSEAYIGSHFDYCKVSYPGPAINSDQQNRLEQRIKEVDAVVFAGGGLIQDVHSTKLIGYSASLAVMAKLYGKITFALGIGAGPIKSAEGWKLTDIFLENMDAIYFRDQASINFAIKRKPALKAAFYQAFDSITLAANNVDCCKVDSPPRVIGICLREWNGLNHESIAQICSHYEQNNAQLVFLAYEKKDVELFDTLNQNFDLSLRLLNDDTFERTLDNIASLDGLISMRLHANLFAMLSGIPFVALAYDPKLKSVFAEFGYPDRVVDLNASPEIILETLAQQFNFPTQQQEQAQTAMNQVMEKLQTMVMTGGTKMSWRKQAYFRLWLLNRYTIKPRFRNLLLKLFGALSPLLPSKLKALGKRFLGINW